MFSSNIFETYSNEVKLQFEDGVQEQRFKYLKGAVVWCGRGYLGTDKDFVHHFDGLPKLFGFYFDEGTVTFKTKFLHNSLYKKTLAQGYLPPVVSFQTKKTRDKFRWKPWHLLNYILPVIKNKTPTTGALEVQNIYGHYLVNYEGLHYAEEIDINTLETLQARRLFKSKVPWNISSSAAAYISDPEETTYYNYLLEVHTWNLGQSATIYPAKIEPNLDVTYFDSVQLEQVGNIHNIVVTNNYLVIIESPERINVKKVIFNGSIFDSMEDLPSENNIFYIYDRYTMKLVRKIRSSFHFSFNHIINSFEEKNTIVIDLIEFSTYYKRLLQPDNPKDRLEMCNIPVRYRIDTRDYTIEREQIWDGLCEMPYHESKLEKRGYANYFVDRPDRQKWGLCSIYEGRTWIPEDGWLVVSSPIVFSDIIMIITADSTFEEFKFVLLEGATFEVIAEALIPTAIGQVAHGNWFDFGSTARPIAPFHSNAEILVSKSK
ncbi:carotenoid oxygenase family protein [Nostoc sp. C117]|uniref:carotenoid oxygenase family protein n=1 Tax=Nostoc sp. C117 TaxID=3349875 RepID=UPI00370DB45B